MIRRPAALLAMTVAVGIALTACAAPSEPAASETPPPVPAETPAPSPTAEILVVAGGEKPPTVFGGDCNSAIDPDVIAESHGIASVTVGAREWADGIQNLGGLTCDWSGGGIVGIVSIIPTHAIEGVRLPADEQKWRFEDCEWACEWQWQDQEVWVTGYSSDLYDAGRIEADRRAALVGASVSERYRASEPDRWERETSSWWPSMDCDAIAAVFGSRLSTVVDGELMGYHDTTLASTAVGDLASNMTWCNLVSSGTTFAELKLMSGMAWQEPRNAPSGESFAPYPVDVEGVEAFTYQYNRGYLLGSQYSVSDGVNLLLLVVADDSPWNHQELVPIIAQLAVDDWM